MNPKSNYSGQRKGKNFECHFTLLSILNKNQLSFPSLFLATTFQLKAKFAGFEKKKKKKKKGEKKLIERAR